jgi:hypothetical protein
MKKGDLILGNRNPKIRREVGGSVLSSLAYKGTVFFFLALLLLSTVVADADICRAASGNHSLFNSVGLLAQFNSAAQLDALAEKERSRLERSDLDAYRNERQRWHQLRDEAKDRLAARHSKKPTRSHSTL